MDEHIIEALGKTRVVIKNGKVVEIGEPKVCYCPLFEKYRGIKKLTSEEIAKNIQFRIDDFGNQRIFLRFGVHIVLIQLNFGKMTPSATVRVVAKRSEIPVSILVVRNGVSSPMNV